MAIRKSDLYTSLWASCDALRGGMDASQYKDYVLTLLFIKYISDKHKSNPEKMLLDVPPDANFDVMVSLKNNKNLGEEINKIIKKIADANKLDGVINVADFNDNDKLGKDKEKVDRLTKLIGIFEELDLGSNKADGDDLLGDAYEYLMRHFATESGKSKGQFYTPAEVSQVVAKVVGINKDTLQDATVYDPTCGSGSLLLKASDEAPNGLTIYGQEMDNTTSALARMNMILHNAPTATIVQGNTLSSPYWANEQTGLKRFDFAVANPPFSSKNWDTGIDPAKDAYKRFDWGMPPDKNGDYAFLLHLIKSLKSTGKGAIILPHGVLFRGNAEAAIRQRIIKEGVIKGIIGLPANLFYGTGIPACIIVIDKQHASARKGIFMVDASKGFIKDGNKNRLRNRDVHRIVTVFNDQIEQQGYSRMVPLSEVEANDYNLNLPRYIDSSESEDLQDLTAHLNGGIPNVDVDALAPYWQVFPKLRGQLFAPLRAGYSQALIEPHQLKNTILQSTEFIQFAHEALQCFDGWSKQAALDKIEQGVKPKTFIHNLSEQLLRAYESSQLLSAYAIYQILMDYWSQTMQDDIYLLVQDGWIIGQKLREIFPSKDKNNKNVWKEPHDFEINKRRFVAEIIPPALIIACYFQAEQEQLEQYQSKADQATQILEEYIEEHAGEEGLLNDALNDKDKITGASIKERLKHTRDEEEIAVLNNTQQLISQEKAAKEKVKKAQDALTLATFKKYPELNNNEIKTLIVQDKWLSTLKDQIQAEIERIAHQLSNRIKELEERYDTPLPQLEKSVDEWSEKVNKHLKAMGLEWSV